MTYGADGKNPSKMDDALSALRAEFETILTADGRVTRKSLDPRGDLTPQLQKKLSEPGGDTEKSPAAAPFRVGYKRCQVKAGVHQR